jgi:hypothetical protein
VEHEEHGYGPYLKPEEFEDEDGISSVYSETHWDVEGLHDAHENSDDHPGPRMDGLSWERTHYHVFGFISRETLDTWFKGFKRKLKAAGFVVRVYEASGLTTHVGESEKQCIFVKHEAKLVDTQSVIAYRRT